MVIDYSFKMWTDIKWNLTREKEPLKTMLEIFWAFQKYPTYV